MNPFLNNTPGKTLPSTLVVEMALMMAHSSAYRHSHRLENGTIITHSHPYDKSKDTEHFKSHQHSKSEILLYRSLKAILFLFFLAISFIFFVNEKAFLIDKEREYSKLLTSPHQGRAPPFL